MEPLLWSRMENGSTSALFGEGETLRASGLCRHDYRVGLLPALQAGNPADLPVIRCVRKSSGSASHHLNRNVVDERSTTRWLNRSEVDPG
jgi:hypothetical protein